MSYDETLWHSYAQVYDEVLRVLPYRNLLLELVDQAGIKPGMKVLDIGCGTGNLLWALDEQHVSCDYTGLDYSDEMLVRARKKAASSKTKATFSLADVSADTGQWALKGPFDRFIFGNSLWVFPDPTSVLKKAHALAAPGAIVVATTPRPDPNVSELLEEHLRLAANQGMGREEALTQLLPKLQPLIQANELLFKRYADSDHLPLEPKLRDWFTKAGWRISELGITYAGQNWLVTASV